MVRGRGCSFTTAVSVAQALIARHSEGPVELNQASYTRLRRYTPWQPQPEPVGLSTPLATWGAYVQNLIDGEASQAEVARCAARRVPELGAARLAAESGVRSHPPAAPALPANGTRRTGAPCEIALAAEDLGLFAGCDRSQAARTPLGLMPLANCAAYLTARIGDDRLSHPVEVWEHTGTGELRFQPDVRELYEVHDLCLVQMLHVLRTGAVTALLPGGTEALPADFWQWPQAIECVRTGLWQGKQLLMARAEMDDVVKAVSAALQEPSEPADRSPTGTGAPGRPSSMHLIEPQLDSLVGAGKSWPSKAEGARDLLKLAHHKSPGRSAADEQSDLERVQVENTDRLKTTA